MGPPGKPPSIFRCGLTSKLLGCPAAPDVAERREGADMFGEHRVADLEAVANGREFYFGHSGQHGHQPQPGRRVQVGIQLKHQWPITSSASPASARAEMTTSHPAASPRA